MDRKHEITMTGYKVIFNIATKGLGAFMLLWLMLFTSELSAQVVINQNTLTSSSYTVQQDGQISITISGADGGNGSNTLGGKGATVTASFYVNAGDIIRYVVGENGQPNAGSSGGGGGSTGVFINDVLVMVAGGGGGGDNSNGAVGLGGNTGTAGDAGTGTGPGAAGTNGNGGGTTTNTTAAGGGGGYLSAGGSGNGGGGARGDATTTDPNVLLAIAAGGAGSGTGSRGGQGFTGGGGASSNYSGGGGGYSGGGGAGANGSAGGGGSFVDASALSSNFTAGANGTSNESDGSINATFFPDSDSDGVIDDNDPDDDNDGILDTNETGDTDSDGVPDRLDLDSDNDGLSDILESGADYTTLDPDNNGIIDGNQFNDTDSDGLSDDIEATNGANTGTTPAESADDADSIPNFLDLDSDGDGLPDNIEAQATSTYSAPTFVNNATNRGVNDNGLFIPVNSDQLHANDDTIPDYLDTDSDGDGFTDASENGGDVTTAPTYADPNGNIDDPTQLTNAQNPQTAEVDFRDETILVVNPPSDVTATAISAGAIQVSFDDVGSGGFISSYTVKRATSPGGPYTQVGTVTDNESASYTFTDNTTNDGTTYYYIVTSTSSGSTESANSDEANATADATNPTFESAVVDGASMLVDFSEILDGTSVPVAGDFDVKVNGISVGVSTVSISNVRVNIGLTNPVQPGDNVTISYTSGTNAIRDEAGNNATNFVDLPVNNITIGSSAFGPDPCPIFNGQDASWACFDGANNGTSMDAKVGDLTVASVTAASGSQTTFSPNAIQEWSSGAFSGDQFNGPQANPSGNAGNTTSFDINVPAGVPSDAIIFSLNKLRPNAGATTYTIEAFDGSNNKVALNGWTTGQGGDGGVCTNSINLNYTNANTTLELQPTVSGNSQCASSSNPIWFRVTSTDVRRIEVRKVATQPDNIHVGIAIKADYGDAPNTYRTTYSSRTASPAFHLLTNTGAGTVYFGTGVDGDGNGAPGANADGDDTETAAIDGGDDESGISSFPLLRASDQEYTVTISATTGARVGAWIDFNQNGFFDASEYTSAVASGGSATLRWSGLSGLSAGDTYARFRIATNASSVSTPYGFAIDGEVEDYKITIDEPATPDLDLTKTVNNSTPTEGEEIVYTLSVTNPGTFMASGVKVTDQLPAGVTYSSHSETQGSYNVSTGVWNIGTLAQGSATTVTLTITATVDENTLGNSIDNNAEITSLNESDPDLTNNSATASITVVPEEADIAITKTANKSQALEGELITYTVVVTNNGPKPSTSLKVVDQLPTGLDFESATTTKGVYVTSSGIWDIGVLGVGEQETLTIVARAAANTKNSTIVNTADLNSQDQTDNNSANNTSSASVDIIEATIPANCLDIPTLDFSTFTLQSGSAGQVGAIYRYTNVTTGVDAEIEIITNNNASLVNFDQATTGTAQNFQPQIEAVDKTLAEAYIDFEIRFYEAGTSTERYLTFTSTGVDVDGDNQDTREFVGFQRLSSFTIETATNLLVGTEGIYTTFEAATSAVVNGIDPNATENAAYTTYKNEPKFRLRAGLKDPTNGATGGAAQRLFSFNFDACIKNNFTNPTSENVVDVGVVKTVNNNNPQTSGNITYTIEVSNKQNNAVGGVEVTDNFPGGVLVNNITVSQGTFNGNTWNVGTLTGLQTATATINATVTATANNTVNNTATLTAVNGRDGNSNNNSSTATFVVQGFGGGCNEPPLYNFTNPSLEEGVDRQLNAVYRFSNVGPGLDALVKVKSLVNAVIDQIDADGSANRTQNFSPFYTSTSNGGYVEWQITFVESGTFNPVKQTFALTALDIDGGANQTQSVRDYLSFAQNSSNTVQSGNNLTESTVGEFQRFESSVAAGGNGSFDIDHIAYISYKYSSVFEIRTGSFTTGNLQASRLVDIDFVQCNNEEFTNPVVTTRDADLAVTKTADKQNLLENETVNFTIDVTNNGPERATEIDVYEKLPTGLTLVQANPTQGAYNQINGIWSVGTIANGASAQLDIEATLDAGVSADSLVNTAYVLGFNQVDPNQANDTSSVTLTLSNQVDGIVFRDRLGNGITDGDTNFGDAAGDQQALKDVEVHLFKDGGDGVADGVDDTYIGSDSTSTTGKFDFNIGADGDYWVVVDSKTGGLSNGTTWAEQTYAPAGALCSDGAGSSTTKASAGNCFGGRRGGVSDNISTNPVPSDLANAEHVAKFTMAGANITDLDFGFSFNVVTDTRDTDDDGTAARTAQGSLRQFIQNANAISGSNAMRFVPAVPTNASGSGGSWWTVTLNSALPQLTDALTTVNGTAYDLNAPTSVIDTNSGTVGFGGQVGTDQQSLNVFDRKELEVNLNDVGNTAFSINSSGSIIVRNMAFYNGSRSIDLVNTNSGTIERNFLGARADGTNPGGANRSEAGLVLSGSGNTSALLQRNYIAYTTGSGVSSTNANANMQFTQNEVYQTATGVANADGMEVVGTWMINRNLFHENGFASSNEVYGGSGIEVGNSTGTVVSGITIRNNTIRDQKVAGISVLNRVSNSIIEKNIITGNGTNYSGTPYKGAGVKLSFPDAQPQQGILISKNSFSNNFGLGIDVVTTGTGAADGVTPNDGVTQDPTVQPNKGLDYPVFTLATVSGSQLTVEGYMGTNSNRVSGTYTIEVYKAADDGNNDGLIEVGGTLSRPHGEGQTLIGTITTASDGSFSESFTVSGASIAVNDRITAIAYDSGNNTSEFSSNQRVVPTGVSVSGYVFHDTNHNTNRDNSESGLENVTVVLYNRQLNNCKSVLTDANGFYQFTNVLNGSYDLIESFGQSVPTPDVCTPAENDPDNFISTTPNLRTVTVNNLPVQQNFGDFEGSKVEGRVFNDNGIGGGTANDGILNGGEVGIQGKTVKALTGADALIEQTTSNAEGRYTLWIPRSVVGSGGTVKIQETNGTSHVSTGGTAGTTGGSYDINTDVTTFTNTVAQEYTGVNFGDVQLSSFLTDGNQNIQPGSIALFTHTFNAKTAGDVTFSTSSVNNPTGSNWPIVLYRDTNCNGAIDSGEPVLDGTNAVSVVANETVCVVLKVTAPQGVNNGATSTTTITADFVLSGTSPQISQTLTRSDIVVINDQEAGLVIVKSVDKTSALPGEILTYTISYQNNGDEPLSSLEIIDNTPIYTTYNSGSCGTLPNNLTSCTITAPAVGSSGGVKWTFGGTLAPGATGQVSYTVKIDN
ncbi:GEVED domain-containing protein [Balneola vulgaris]|uniref:GEVED domain-containing protein n=1 Tax=Balneola vulgaris TaxID=287535 RepID=UPI00036A6291|nr:GEVED domain-containing protein [Balneola vulgaris]